MVKYCVLDLLKCAPEFREEGTSNARPVEVKLEPSFYRQVALLMPDAEASQPEKRILNQDMYERAQKKHKNFLRRQRAKQAKQQQKKEQAEKAETSSDSGVSTKSEQKPVKQQIVTTPKVQVIVTPPKNTNASLEARTNNVSQQFPKQPVSAFKNNFQNQGKLRASSEEDSLNGESKMGGQVFIAQPVEAGKGGSRSWANSRLKRQRSRIGSRS